MDKDQAIFILFKLQSTNFILQDQLNKRYNELKDLFDKHANNEEARNIFKYIKWARDLMQVNSNCVAYARDGLKGLHARTQRNSFWANLDKIQSAIEELESSHASEPRSENEEDFYFMETPLSDHEREESPSPMPQPDTSRDIVPQSPARHFRGAAYKTRPRRILGHKMRGANLTLLTEWAPDLPPTWETQADLTTHFRPYFKAALELYKEQFPRKFIFILNHPGIIEVYRD